MPCVRLSWLGRVAVLKMDDQARRNALGASMLRDLAGALAECAEARAVIIRNGPEDKVWCAGFDIGALARGVDPLDADGALQGLFRTIRDHPAPVIAMVHGSCWGGGADLALRCDIVVADPTATLAFTPSRLGLPYDADGLLNVMLRAGLNTAMEMFTAGEPLPAARAYQLGLLNHLVPEDQLESHTYALASRIAANAPLSVQSAKRHLRALAEAIPLTPTVMAALQASRRRALDSEDYAAGIDAFHARVSPEFKGR